ncbi:IS6 family transposase [Alicyclobacillus sp. ALC3]|nr:IS6 family transposase [Alicyclobacillus sp. ALC3]
MRDIVQLQKDRGVQVTHTIIMPWVHQYSPEFEKRIPRFLKPTTDSYKVNKTYVEVKGHWKYLYRAVGSKGQTIEFILPANRDILVAKRFFKKTFCSPHNQSPRVVTIDKYPTYPPSLQQL